MTRGEPAVWHARLRVAPLYSVGPVLGPDHEAIIRFGGKAPRQRAHSNERFDDRVPARVTTTSDRDRPTRQRRLPWRAEILCAWAGYRGKRSGGWPQHNAMRDFTGGDHAPEGDEQLAGECHDHLRLARSAGSLGPGTEPLSQSAVLLKQQKPPSELDHAATYAGIARLGEAFLAPFRSAFVRRASKPRVACDGPSVAQVTRRYFQHQQIGRFDAQSDDAGQQPNHCVRRALRYVLQMLQASLLNFLDLLTQNGQSGKVASDFGERVRRDQGIFRRPQRVD